MSPDEGKGTQPIDETGAKSAPQRTMLRQLGRFAAITPPAVTLLLSAVSKPAAALTSGGGGSSRQFKEPVSVPQLRKAA